MPQPQPRDLPGYYFDQEKNRYFPIKGPIPGSSSSKGKKTTNLKSPETSPSQSQEKNKTPSRKLRSRISKLLQARELDGHHVNASPYRKCNFTEEYRKFRASQPAVWKYQGTDNIGISGLEHIYADVQTEEGQSKTDILLTGSIDGTMSFSEVGRISQHFDGGIKWLPDCVKGHVNGTTDEYFVDPDPILRPNGAALLMPSRISSLRLGQEYSSDPADDGPIVGQILFTTLGSETSGGSIFTLNLVEPLDLGEAILNTWGRLEEITSLKNTIWTAEYDYHKPRAIVGTNLGGVLVDLETRATSWFLHCKSDVFAQQVVDSGNVILCGLRNGEVVSVDSRGKKATLSAGTTTPRISYVSSNKKRRRSKKDWIQPPEKIHPTDTVKMPSSISSLVALQFDDQYYLASSMDGSMKLYDRRLIERGAVQSYEGHVNSHTHIQLGVDPSEKFVMSGGEDCKLRLWSIKTGELLLEDKFCDSIISSVCYRKYKSDVKAKEENEYELESSLGAWLGSHQGLFYMQW